MTLVPSIVHRYSFQVTEVIETLVGDAVADCEAMNLRIEGDLVVIDFVVPSAPPGRRVVAGTPPVAADPEPVEQRPEEAKPAKRKGGLLAQRAGIICAERGFWTFVAKRYSANVGSTEAAATWLRAVCNKIESRADLDHDPHAASVFNDISKAYALWLDGYG